MKNIEERFYDKRWFGILMLFLFAPVGIYLMWNNNHFKKNTRIVLSVLSSLFFIFTLTSNNEEAVENSEVDAVETREVAEVESIDKEEVITEDEPEEEVIEEVDSTEVEEEEEIVEKVAVDLDIDIEVTETELTDEQVIVRGTTNLIDDAFLAYQIDATEGNVKVSNGEWEIVEDISTLEKDDEYGFYADETEYDLFISFPSYVYNEEDPSEEVLTIYGGTGATNITGGPGFYESEDGTLKSVFIDLYFDENGVITSDEREERAFDSAVEDWEDYRSELMDHYDEFGIIDIKAVEGYDVFYAYVPNEFKMSTDNEKQYYVEQIGPILVSDLNSHFGGEAWLEFMYQDGNRMASRKILGGWKIQ